MRKQRPRLCSFLPLISLCLLTLGGGCGIERAERAGLEAPPVEELEKALKASRGELVRAEQPKITAPQMPMEQQLREIAPRAEMLQSRYPETRTVAALKWREIINQSIEGSLRALGQLLKHPQWQTRLAAAEILKFAYDPRAASVLATAADDPHPLVRQSVAEGMGLLGGAVAMDTLIKLSQDPEPWVRKSAAAAFSFLPPDKRAQARLVGLVSDPDPRVRELAAESLAIVGCPDASAALIKALENDTEPVVRQYAASALGSLEAKDGVEALLKALDDPAEEVRWAAARSLGFCAKPGDKTVIRRLRQVRANDFAFVRFAAELSLRKLGYHVAL